LYELVPELTRHNQFLGSELAKLRAELFPRQESTTGAAIGTNLQFTLCRPLGQAFCTNTCSKDTEMIAYSLALRDLKMFEAALTKQWQNYVRDRMVRRYYDDLIDKEVSMHAEYYGFWGVKASAFNKPDLIQFQPFMQKTMKVAKAHELTTASHAASLLKGKYILSTFTFCLHHLTDVINSEHNPADNAYKRAEKDKAFKKGPLKCLLAGITNPSTWTTTSRTRQHNSRLRKYSNQSALRKPDRISRTMKVVAKTLNDFIKVAEERNSKDGQRPQRRRYQLQNLSEINPLCLGDWMASVVIIALRN
jgi:hypothetical protein